jgi:hypothetical protein
MAHTESENRLAPLTLVDRQAAFLAPAPVDLEEAGLARLLKASGGQVCLVVCRQEPVSLCQTQPNRIRTVIF